MSCSTILACYNLKKIFKRNIVSNEILIHTNEEESILGKIDEKDQIEQNYANENENNMFLENDYKTSIQEKMKLNDEEVKYSKKYFEESIDNESENKVIINTKGIEKNSNIEKENSIEYIKNKKSIIPKLETENQIMNINTATLEELKTLKGIADKRAEAIIKYREKNGKFENVEDIKEVYGIGDGIFSKIKNFIKVK
ncbi:MAG: helix-hairpin-helix domain-containing protein [Clostridiales bacterium]|nr:helix-hairpin-helix domain-containing protein [Clostridiales bacterium]